MDPVQHILVPVDFSACSRRALDCALLLAERFGAKVDILHVRELNVAWAWAPLDVVAFDASHGLLADEVGASHSLWQWVEEATKRSRSRVHGRLERGDPLHTILEVAAREPYDLIVMGTHGRTGMSLPLLGGITRKVMHKARCPVLTVHAVASAPKPAVARVAP